MSDLTMAQRLAQAAQEGSNNAQSGGTTQSIPEVNTVSSETVAGKSKSGF